MEGKTALGASSPANPALHMPEPLSTTRAATSSSHILLVSVLVICVLAQDPGRVSVEVTPECGDSVFIARARTSPAVRQGKGVRTLVPVSPVCGQCVASVCVSVVPGHNAVPIFGHVGSHRRNRRAARRSAQLRAVGYC